MILVLDTTLVILHYFSDDENVLARTSEILRTTRKLGSRGILPATALAEFHAKTYKRTGREIADKHFREIELWLCHRSAEGRDIVGGRLAEAEVPREGALRGLHRRRLTRHHTTWRL